MLSHTIHRLVLLQLQQVLRNTLRRQQVQGRQECGGQRGLQASSHHEEHSQDLQIPQVHRPDFLDPQEHRVEEAPVSKDSDNRRKHNGILLQHLRQHDLGCQH